MAEEIESTIRAMERMGGSFVRALAECYRRADSTNKKKIETTWPEYFKEYKDLAKKIEERKHA
jgi:pyruvate/2-oxoacid:ferredoxin oxidoreductase beta subunit